MTSIIDISNNKVMQDIPKLLEKSKLLEKPISPFKIKTIHMFSSWVYNLPTNQDCTICRCNLNTSSLYNQEKCLDSNIIIGKCQHSFHEECIKPWVAKNKHCPICVQVWQISHKIN